MSEWQPIGTAPKGEYILVYRAGLGPKAVSSTMIGFRKTATKWWPDSLCGRGAATHWMPLPTPPVGNELAQADETAQIP